MTLQAIKKRLLDLAIRGQLVPQIPSEGTADNLLQQIADEHRATFAPQQGKKYKPLTFSNIPDSEIPFEIPTNWKWVRLGEIVLILTGGTPPKSNKDYYGNDYPFYKPTDLDQGFNTIVSSDNVSELGYNVNNVKLPINSVLVTCIGATIGKAGIIRKEGTCNQQINAIVANKNLCSEYVFYTICSTFFQQQIIINSSSTTLPILNKSKFSNLLFPLPPLSEQHRIVSKLDLMLKEISVIEDSQKSLDGLSTAIWRRSLAEAIAGRLTTQLESDGTADILLDQIKAAQREAFDAEQAKAKAATEKSGKKFVPKKYTPLTFSQIPQSEIPFDIPDNWKWVRLGEIAETMLGKTLDREKNTGEYCNYLCAVNIKWMKIDFSVLKQIRLELTDKEKYRLKKGDLLVCEGGDVARSAIWEDDSREMYYQNALHRIRFYGGINQYYILYVIYVNKLSGYIDRISKGVTIKHFTQDLLKNLLIPLPPLSEQERIVAKLDRLRGALGRD